MGPSHKTRPIFCHRFITRFRIRAYFVNDRKSWSAVDLANIQTICYSVVHSNVLLETAKIFILLEPTATLRVRRMNRSDVQTVILRHPGPLIDRCLNCHVSFTAL